MAAHTRTQRRLTSRSRTGAAWRPASWRWDELTCPDFARARRAAKHTCLVPLGCLEKHGEHLPLGTDAFQAQDMALRAAAREPVVVFPGVVFGQIHEAKHHPGTVAFGHDLLLGMLENLCNEIARNGFRRIVILNGHGGNEGLLAVFARKRLEQPLPYTLYVIRVADYYPFDAPKWKELQESTVPGGHGCEVETSIQLALRPHLVRMDDVAARPGLALGRQRHLPPVLTGIRWYADFPGHYAGDARTATAKKGEYLLGYAVGKIVRILRAAKTDTVTPRLEKEFHARTNHRA